MIGMNKVQDLFEEEITWLGKDALLYWVYKDNDAFFDRLVVFGDDDLKSEGVEYDMETLKDYEIIEVYEIIDDALAKLDESYQD